MMEERVTKVTWKLYQSKAFSFHGADRVACISTHRIIGLTAETLVIDAQDLPALLGFYFTHQRLYPAPQFSKINHKRPLGTILKVATCMRRAVSTKSMIDQGMATNSNNIDRPVKWCHCHFHVLPLVLYLIVA